jgi:Lon protease-like protein
MDLPLFPLHTVLCPGIALPLHVFEPRYRVMIGRCLAAGTPFGVVLIVEGREVGDDPVALATVGTVAEIREAKRRPEGRFDITAVGTRRFILDSVDSESEPYLVGDIQPLPETVVDEIEARALVGRVSRRFLRYLDLLKPVEGEDGPELDVRLEVDIASDDDTPGESIDGAERSETGFDRGPATRRRPIAISNDPTTLAHLLSGIVRIDPTRRQELLEAQTTEDRLRELDRLLDLEIPLLSRRLRHYTADPRLNSLRRN